MVYLNVRGEMFAREAFLSRAINNFEAGLGEEGARVVSSSAGNYDRRLPSCAIFGNLLLLTFFVSFLAIFGDLLVSTLF